MSKSGTNEYQEMSGINRLMIRNCNKITFFPLFGDKMRLKLAGVLLLDPTYHIHFHELYNVLIH